MNQKITVGKFNIYTHQLPVHEKANCLSIHVNEGDSVGEGGTFSMEKFEKAVEEFYNREF